MAPKGKVGGKVGTKGKKTNPRRKPGYSEVLLQDYTGSKRYLCSSQSRALYNTSTFWTWFFLLFALVVYVGSYKSMSAMAKAAFADDDSLLDGGIDLNMEQGLAEHLKDVILLTAIVQVLSSVILLLVPLAPGTSKGFAFIMGRTSWVLGFLLIHNQSLKRTRKMIRNRGDRKDVR